MIPQPQVFRSSQGRKLVFRYTKDGRAYVMYGADGMFYATAVNSYLDAVKVPVLLAGVVRLSVPGQRIVAAEMQVLDGQSVRVSEGRGNDEVFHLVTEPYGGVFVKLPIFVLSRLFMGPFGDQGRLMAAARNARQSRDWRLFEFAGRPRTTGGPAIGRPYQAKRIEVSEKAVAFELPDGSRLALGPAHIHHGSKRVPAFRTDGYRAEVNATADQLSVWGGFPA